MLQNFLQVSPELGYIIILFLLFVLPKVLQRWGIPAALTAMGLGAAAGLGLGVFTDDHTVQLLSTFGIVSLFLFAGLEVDVDDLRKNSRVLTQHLIVGTVLLVIVAVAVGRTLHVDGRVATLVALALVTPSTGFILDSLGMLGLSPREAAWIKSKAIAKELLALLVLFATLQSTRWEQLLFSTGVLVLMITLLPVAFQVFARLVVPHAPRSEFAFLLMVAVVCAYVTRELGVYYLVGAFVVGMAAQRFREKLPALASEDLLRAVQLFASFFVPFYFFHAGLHLHAEDFSLQAVALAAVFLVVAVPLRLVSVTLHRKIVLGEKLKQSLRIAVPMLPTLVFGLVIAGILRDRFAVSGTIFGALVMYTLGATLVPAFVFRSKIPDYTELEAPPLQPNDGA